MAGTSIHRFSLRPSISAFTPVIKPIPEIDRDPLLLEMFTFIRQGIKQIKRRKNRLKKKRGHHRASFPKNKSRGKNRLRCGKVFHGDTAFHMVFWFVVSRTFVNTLKSLKSHGSLKVLGAISHYGTL